MNNFNYKKKYHYLVKYIFIAFPILYLIFSSLRGVSITSLYTFCNEFLNLDINTWYMSILDLLSFSLSSEIGVILLSIPLYILWLYAFDLLIDIFGLILNLAHSLLYKLGGGIND